ncbi:hypothetical protein [Gemmatimonas sp.]|uniref:hypothetical protein n=1 Tax=Gemmatimonas sp. TaxID=1962908 RepID=UPI0037BE236C
MSDSTATFRMQEAWWIEAGMVSYVVDPMQRDALVARLRIITRDSVFATALVTSQVARVRPEHFLLVPRPPVPWWRNQRFWAGTALGFTIGAVGVASAR